MALTGQAKTDYQRGYMKGYMRKRRASTSVKTRTIGSVPLRPKQPVMLRPVGISGSQWNYIQFKAEQEANQ